MKRLLITGANGGLGSVCRDRLTHMADIIRLNARRDMGEPRANEEIVLGDLSDPEIVNKMVEGCDGIVHMGGQPNEATWDVVRDSNIDGVFNLYEAARLHGVKRIIFASSNHAIGFYPQDQKLDAKSPPRPDTLYGVSKAFGEALASLYYDKFGIETARVRIGSCFPEANNHRMLSTWMSYDDFILLIERAFTVPHLGCPIIYGASANDASWWDNTLVDYIGWQPKDNAEQFRAAIDAAQDVPDKNDINAQYQGGGMTATDYHNRSDKW